MNCILFLALFVILQYSDAHPTREYMPRPRLDGRIVGGNPIDILEAPYQVSLQRGSHFCGGSLIGSEWVLTAAHCTDGQNPAFIKVRVGSSTHQFDGILITVKEIVQHQNFSYQNIDWDYSLIHLNASLNFDATKSAISLPEQNEVIKDKASCIVTGWGNTQNSSESRNVLRKADVPIVNQVKCSQAYKNYGGVTARMLCAGLEEGGKDACQGDSGGPLVCKGKIFGIVSWGYGCAQPKYPGIYSRVPLIREWIREHTGI
jgi:trypsin